MHTLLRGMPKTELHIHIEGSLEPELIFALAQRNQVTLPFADVESLRAAYDFKDLQSFLDIYYAGASVLLKEADFYDMTLAYLKRAHHDGVVYAEIFFDPQTHTHRGVSMADVISGIDRACQDAQSALGIESALILCFLRHLDEQDAFKTLDEAIVHLDRLIGVGLDSSELGHPPEKFERVFAKARSLGLKVVAHAGEEGPAAYIWGALKALGAQRIDHGVQCIEDEQLLAELKKSRVPLTICPLSNVKLCVYDHLSQHPLKKLLDLGLCVTVNSDDPAYFGGYIYDNYVELFKALDLDEQDAIALAACSIEAAFVPQSKKDLWLERLRAFHQSLN
jgi:adenosine deaminase